MAKALIGHLDSDLRGSVALLHENRHLRRRVGDLEALVLSLQVENDRLAAEVRASSELAAELDRMQPA